MLSKGQRLYDNSGFITDDSKPPTEKMASGLIST